MGHKFTKSLIPNTPKHADLALRKNGWVKMVFLGEDISLPVASRLIQTKLGRKIKFADSKASNIHFAASGRKPLKSEGLSPPPMEIHPLPRMESVPSWLSPKGVLAVP